MHITFCRNINDNDWCNHISNITNKNICFNADKFDDLKKILNCDYANFVYITKNKETFVYEIFGRLSILTFPFCHF